MVDLLPVLGLECGPSTKGVITVADGIVCQGAVHGLQPAAWFIRKQGDARAVLDLGYPVSVIIVIKDIRGIILMVNSQEVIVLVIIKKSVQKIGVCPRLLSWLSVGH